MLHIQGVRAGLGIDQHGRGFEAVLVCRGAIIRSTQLDPANVPHSSHASLAIRLDNDVAELVRRNQSAQCLDVDLIGSFSRDGRLIQYARRDLQILRAECRKDLVRTQIVGRGLIRVEPDAHRILAIALPLHVGDTRQTGKHILQVQGDVI